MLTADELLAGSTLTHEVDVPPHLRGASAQPSDGKIRLRPLTVRDLQLIARAAKENDALTGAVMVVTALLEPKLTLPQVNGMAVGLLEFLLDQVNRVSGLTIRPEELRGAAADPLVRATHLLTREFGWTPEQVGQLTVGQVLLHLQLLKDKQVSHG